MIVLSALDSAGRRRSPATLPGYHAGRSPRNKGMRYPADPPTVMEIVTVMRHVGDDRHGWRVRAMIVALWRAGLRIQEALALAEHDLDARRGSVLIRNGKGGRPREVGMDDWGWEQLRPGSRPESSCRLGRCSASSTARTAGDRGAAQLYASSSAASPLAPGSGARSRRTSCATRTRLNSPARVLR
jgi:integrase